MKTIFFAILAFSLLFTGCMTTNDIEVYSTKSWEGHYMTTEEFYEKTKDINLEKNESIWVLSNRSLSRALKDKEEKK